MRVLRRSLFVAVVALIATAVSPPVATASPPPKIADAISMPLVTPVQVNQVVSPLASSLVLAQFSAVNLDNLSLADITASADANRLIVMATNTSPPTPMSASPPVVSATTKTNAAYSLVSQKTNTAANSRMVVTTTSTVQEVAVATVSDSGTPTNTAKVDWTKANKYVT